MIDKFLNNKEKEKLNKWMEEQLEKAPRDEYGRIISGCSGGMFTYEFTPTTLGTVVRVINNLNKEVVDLTDYKSW